jgi:hypothetical protein
VSRAVIVNDLSSFPQQHFCKLNTKGESRICGKHVFEKKILTYRTQLQYKQHLLLDQPSARSDIKSLTYRWRCAHFFNHQPHLKTPGIEPYLHWVSWCAAAWAIVQTVNCRLVATDTQGSNPGQSMQDRCGQSGTGSGFFSKFFGVSLSVLSAVILNYHTGYEQHARWWPQFTDMLSPHRNEHGTLCTSNCMLFINKSS